MSTLKVINLQHPSSGTVNAALTSGGLLTGAGLDLITTSTFSAVSSVSVNNCFTSTYENYRVLVSAYGSAAVAGRIRLRASGVDASGATDYITQEHYTVSTTVAGAGSNTSSGAWCSLYTVEGDTAAVMDIFAPALARHTHVVATSGGRNTATTMYIQSDATVHLLATAYDGLTLYPASGTFSGTLRIYGYRNS